jgi:hypothetical protein
VRPDGARRARAPCHAVCSPFPIVFIDNVRAELGPGITIDVAYRFIPTPQRWFVLAGQAR